MLIHHNYNYFSIPVFLFHEYLWDGICDCVDGAVSWDLGGGASTSKE